jgi:hypothetical protein
MPWNVLYLFKNSQWTGVKPSDARSDFQIIPDNPGFAPYVQNCKFFRDWNAHQCENEDLGLLVFESQEDERFDRAVQPVILNRQGTEMANTLNAYMDHIWDGFYTGQQRLPRFPALVETPRGSIYDITFTSNPPKKLMFELQHKKATAGTTIRIAYPDAISMQILKDGKKIDMNQWDKEINQYGEIKQRFCGENRYIGVKNILEFYITPYCKIHIQPRNAIQTQVRMEWTIEDFYSNGGTTTLVDRISAVLGIHASQIKVVSVYEGSLVLNYEITPDEEASETSDADQLS